MIRKTAKIPPTQISSRRLISIEYFENGSFKNLGSKSFACIQRFAVSYPETCYAQEMCRVTPRIFFCGVMYSNHCVGFKLTGGFFFCVNFATVIVVLPMGHSRQKVCRPPTSTADVYRSKVMA